MKKKIIILVCYFLFNFSSTAQDIELKGRVIEHKKSEPLSFVTIEIKSLRTGTYTDNDGYFTINISKKNQNDTIEFYALGYKKKKIIINKLLDSENKVIKLEQKVFNLKEVNIKPKKTKIIKFGVNKRKPWKYQVANIFGGQYGHYIRNKDNLSGFVKTVSFYIANVGHTDAPFRIRVYKHDKKNNCPGEDILNKNLIVQNKNGAGWFTVNISDYYIRFPKDGMHIMMEWIYSGDKYYYTQELTKNMKDGTIKKIQRKLYGQSVGNLLKQKEICLWSKGFGVNWGVFDMEYKGYYINIMVNAEIEVEK